MKNPREIIDGIDRAISRLSDQNAIKFLYAIRAEIVDLEDSMKTTQRLLSRAENTIKRLSCETMSIKIGRE